MKVFKVLFLLLTIPFILAAQITTIPGGGGGADDQTAAEVPFTPAGTIAATDVQAAIEEVATEAGGAADVQTMASINCTDAGANDTYTCSLTPTINDYAADIRTVWFDPNTANTGAATLNIDSVGALPIYKHADGTNLANNDLRANKPVLLVYCDACNSTNGAFILQELGNAPSGVTTLDSLSDVDVAGATTGAIVYKSAGDWVDDTTILVNPATTPNVRILAQDASHTPLMVKGIAAQTAPVFNSRNNANADFWKLFDTGKICWEGATVDGTNMVCLDTAGDPAGAINHTFSHTAGGQVLTTGDGALNDDDLSDNSLNDLGTKTENLLTQRTFDTSIATEITLDTNGDATLPTTGGHRKFDTFADASSDTWDTVVCTAGTSGTIMAANDARTIIISNTIISNWPLDVTLDEDGDVFFWACPSANTMIMAGQPVDESGQGTFQTLQVGAAGTPTNDTGVTDDVAPSAPSGSNEFTWYVDRTTGDWCYKLQADSTTRCLSYVNEFFLGAGLGVGGTGYSGWHLATSGAAAVGLATTSDSPASIVGVLDFDATTDECAQATMFMPTNIGSVTLMLKWLAAATTGEVQWNARTKCTGDAQTLTEVSWNGIQSFAPDTAKGTTLQTNNTNALSLSLTGCADTELMQVRVCRNPDASDDDAGVTEDDDMSGDARLIGGLFTFYRN